MRVLDRTRSPLQLRRGTHPGGSSLYAAIIAVLLLGLSLPLGAAAQESSDGEKARSLGVNLLFPDDGLIADEQLCVALFPGTDPDLSAPPLLSRCLDPGNESVIDHGSTMTTNQNSLIESRCPSGFVSVTRASVILIELKLSVRSVFVSTTSKVPDLAM